MKKMHALIIVTMFSATFAACSFDLPSSTVRDFGPATQAGYKSLAITTGAAGELALASNPEVAYGFVIAKTAVGFEKAKFERVGALVLSSFDLGTSTYWQLKKSASLVKFVLDLRGMRGVEWAEPELRSILPPDEGLSVPYAKATRGVAAESAVLDDPSAIADEYALEISRALDSYKPVASGGNDYPSLSNPVYVAQIDTGVNMKHYDFWDGTDSNGVGNGTGNSLIAYAKSAFDFTDKTAGTFTWVGDGNALVTIPQGENWDDVDHGTHTAGTILARGNNKVGAAGVAWKNTRLISYKCFCDHEINSIGSGYEWSIYGSLKDLADWWANTSNHPGQTTIPVNMSLGGSYASNFALEMVNYALVNNVLPIVAMGNEGQVKAQYPAAYSGVVAVGATTGRDEKAPFSSMGDWISVSAPGFDIISTSNGGMNWNSSTDPSVKTGTMWMSGTSMATPFVTGLIGYMLAFNPLLTPDQIKALLESTADDKGAIGFDESYGYGRVDVLAAAKAVRTGAVPTTGSVYVTKAIKISVRNNSTNYDSGISGYPDAVVNQLVTLYNSNDQTVCLGQTDATDGSLQFRLLKPGNYKATSNYFGNYQSTLITLADSQDQNITFSFSVSVLQVQTLPNDFINAGVTDADTVLTLYDSSGTNIIAGPYDSGYLDTLVVPNLSPGAYTVKVTPFTPTSIGEYGLNIGFTAKYSISVDPAPRVAGIDDSDGNIDAAHAKPIVLGQDYSEYLSSNGEWFSFTIP